MPDNHQETTKSGCEENIATPEAVLIIKELRALFIEHQQVVTALGAVQTKIVDARRRLRMVWGYR